MIQIITEKVDMPPVTERRYRKECKNNKWTVLDTESHTIRYKGSYENVVLACHNLNKAHYKSIVK